MKGLNAGDEAQVSHGVQVTAPQGGEVNQREIEVVHQGDRLVCRAGGGQRANLQSLHGPKEKERIDESLENVGDRNRPYRKTQILAMRLYTASGNRIGNSL